MIGLHKEYVLGFAFDNYYSDILLIRKNRGPKHIVGKLNGIGGKIEKGEKADFAMRREGIEECGLDLSWKSFGKLWTKYGNVYLFCYSGDEIYKYRQIEDEEVRVYHVCDYHVNNAVENLCWIIPMSLGVLKKSFLNDSFDIEER